MLAMDALIQPAREYQHCRAQILLVMLQSGLRSSPWPTNMKQTAPPIDLCLNNSLTGSFDHCVEILNDAPKVPTKEISTLSEFRACLDCQA